jgi:predicted phosphoribosyltransferase
MDASGLIELPALRNRARVFRDRAHAGEVLAGMLGEFRGSDALVLGIVAGGVPVAAALARALGLALAAAVVSKITLPWNSEAGYGAVAFGDALQLNQEAIEHFGLSPAEVDKGIARTREKVRERLQRFCAGQAPTVAGRTVVLVDDGLASGFTLLTAIAAVRHGRPTRLLAAVPTAHGVSAQRVVGEVDALYCANVRTSLAFAVADAYEHWADVSEDEALALLRDAHAA